MRLTIVLLALSRSESPHIPTLVLDKRIPTRDSAICSSRRPLLGWSRRPPNPQISDNILCKKKNKLFLHRFISTFYLVRNRIRKTYEQDETNFKQVPIFQLYEGSSILFKNNAPSIDLCKIWCICYPIRSVNLVS